MIEEVNAVFSYFTAIYSLVLFIIDKNPTSETISRILIGQPSVECRKSWVVEQYINSEVTTKMNAVFFSAIDNLRSAEEKIQESYVEDAIVERESRNFLS